MKHRNEKTANGDINKLDEQRKTKNEDYKPASETDKKLMLQEVSGDDGLRTANTNSKIKSRLIPHGLNQEAMEILAQYDIGPHNLYRYDSPETGFENIYIALQKAKGGDNSELRQALEKQFGKRSWWQRRLSELPVGQVSKQAQYDVPVGLGYLDREISDWEDSDDKDELQRFSPDIDSMEQPLAFKDEVAEYGDLIDELTKGVEVPSDDEVNAIKNKDPDAFKDENKPEYVAKDESKDEDEDEEVILPEYFNVKSTQDFSIGKTPMTQVVLSFDKENFDGELEVKHQAASYMFLKYPSLFSFTVQGKPIEVSKSVNVDMNNGRIVVTLPKAAFGS